MIPTEKCPFCSSENVLEGKIKSSEGLHGFQPDEARLPRFSLRAIPGFTFDGGAQFCANCYMIWCKADSLDVEAYLQKYAAESLKQRLAALKPAKPATSRAKS
jgi:hypothetical protein